MPEITCACGCGRTVAEGRTWIRGHSARGRGGFDPARHGDGKVAQFPGPGEDFDRLAAEAEPFGDTISVDDAPPASTPAPIAPTAGAGTPGDEPGDDEPPGHARREWRQRTRQSKSKAAPKITAGVRGDIEAKIGFGVELIGHAWQVRDPLCGGTWLQQTPAIAASFTNWVVRSPQLVEWFTSPAGSGFMLFLDTAAALGPVVSAVMAHHVYHSVEVAPPAEQSAQYAA